MVELDRILDEYSDERLLSAIGAISDAEFKRFVERILSCLALGTMRSRVRSEFIIADCVHRPDGDKYVAFFSRRPEGVSKQSINSLVAYMSRVESPNGLVLSSSTISRDAVSTAQASDVAVADGPKLAALIRRFDLDEPLIHLAEAARERDRVAASASAVDKSLEDRMRAGYEALSARDLIKALEIFDGMIMENEDYDVPWRVKANILDEMGYHEQALECYRRALEIDPDSEETWFSLGNCLFSLSKHAEELKCYDRALEINPVNVKVLVNKGYTLHRLGRYREALDVYDAILKRNFRLEKVHNNRGVTLHKLGRNEEALQSYEHAISLRHDYAEAWMNKGNLLEEMGREEDALDAFKRFTSLLPGLPRGWHRRAVLAHKLGKDPEARRSLNDCLRLDPDNPEAKALLEELGGESGDSPPAEEVSIDEIFGLEEATGVEDEGLPVEPGPMERMPPEPAVEAGADVPAGPAEEEPVKHLAEELYGDRAELLLLLGRLDEAYDYLERSLRLEGENPRLLTAAGNVLFRQGKYEIAAKTYEHAFAADPKYAPALFNLHMSLMVAGEFELTGKVSDSLRTSVRDWQAMTAAALEAAKRRDYRRAIEDVESALAIEDLAMLVNFKGILQMESGDLDGSAETFGRLCTYSFDPSEAHNNLGMALMRKGDWEDAASAFDDAIKLRKGNATAWNNRGCVLYKEERLREAIACFEESLVINPSTVAMTNKGFSQLSLDMLDEALRSFEQSLKIRETPEAFNDKGIVLRRLGRIDESITAFRESLRLYPQFDDASSNLREAIAEQASKVPEPDDEEVPPPPPPPRKERKGADKAALVKRENESSLKAKRKSELEALCIALDISSKGTKKELVARILKEKRRLLKR